MPSFTSLRNKHRLEQTCPNDNDASHSMLRAALHRAAPQTLPCYSPRHITHNNNPCPTPPPPLHDTTLCHATDDPRNNTPHWEPPMPPYSTPHQALHTTVDTTPRTTPHHTTTLPYHTMIDDTPHATPKAKRGEVEVKPRAPLVL